MDRDDSLSSATSTPRYIGARRVPPWEHQDIPQVPYMTDSALPLSSTEKQALPSFWATRTGSRSPSFSAQGGATVADAPAMAPILSRSEYEAWIAQGLEPNHQDGATRARTASPPVSEHYQMIPAYERSYEPAIPENKQPVVAFPGTMSSRSGPGHQHTSSKKASNKRQHKKGSKKPKDSAPLGQRFTSALKDLFRKEHVDDSQFETIDERHWSED